MNDIEVSSIDLVEGGNVFKQGHHLTLGYIPRDEKGGVVDLSNKTLSVSIWGRIGIVFEGPATFSAEIIRFTLKELIPAGEYQVEFTATSSTDADYRKKFPTNSVSGRITVKKSSDDLEATGVSVVTVTQFRKEFDAAVAAVTKDSEVVLARAGETLLGDRLDKDKQELTQHLADKVEKDAPGVITWEMTAQDVRENITGGTTAVVGENSVLPINIVNEAVTNPKVAKGAIGLKNRTADILPKEQDGFSTTHYSFAVGSVPAPTNYGSANSLNGINYRHDTELIEVESGTVVRFEFKSDSLFKISLQEFDGEKKGVADRGYQTANSELALGVNTKCIRLVIAKKDNSFFPLSDMQDIKASVELVVPQSADHRKYDSQRRRIDTMKDIVGSQNLVSMNGDFWEIADLAGTVGTTTLSTAYAGGSGTTSRARTKINRVVPTRGFKKLFLLIPSTYYLDIHFYNANEVLCGIAFLNGANTPDASLYIPDGSVKFSIRLYRVDTSSISIKELENLELMVSFVDHATFNYSPDDVTNKVKRLRNGESSAFSRKRFSDKVRYIGHAGTAAYAPENTIQAVKMAHLMGMRGAECDLCITSDGKLVLMHDFTVDRTTDGTGNVSDMTLAQVQELSVDTGLKQFTNVKVPTLEEYLLACKEYGLTPVIEVKNNGHTTGMVDALIPILKKFNVLESCLLISFGKDTLNYIRSLSDNVHLSYLLAADAPITQADINYAVMLGNASLNINGTNSITAEMITNCHNAGVNVLAWTINDRNLADYLISIGVDMITTDTLIDPHRNKMKFSIVFSTVDKGLTWTVSNSQFSATGVVANSDTYTLSITLNELLKSALSQFEIPISAQNNTYFANQSVVPVVFKENSGLLRMQFLKNGITSPISELTDNALKLSLSIDI